MSRDYFNYTIYFGIWIKVIPSNKFQIQQAQAFPHENIVELEVVRISWQQVSNLDNLNAYF